jgi:hypothetical protein
MATTSPDLIEPDIFMWVCFKSEVYATHPHCIHESKEHITEGTGMINGTLLQQVTQNFRQWLWQYIVMHMSLSVDRIWIGNWIYWTLTECNYSTVANPHTLQFATAHTKSYQSPVSSLVDVLLLLGSNPCSLAAVSHQPPALLSSQDPSNGSWPLLHSLVTSCTENTTSNSSSIVACVVTIT